MQHREVDSPDKWTMSDAWGLGWTLHDWNGVSAFGHDGNAVAQQSYLRVIPQAAVAVVLLANGGDFARLYADLFRQLPTRGKHHDHQPGQRRPRTDLLRVRRSLRTPGPAAGDGPAAGLTDGVAAPFYLGGEAYCPVISSTLANGTPYV